MSENRHISVGGAPEGFDAQLLLNELEKTGKPVFHVARDDKRLAAMQAALAFFAPGIPVMAFPAWDCLPFDRVSPNANVSAARMAALAAVRSGAQVAALVRPDRSDLIIDGVFGVGFRGALPDKVTPWTVLDTPVLSVDVTSGLDA